MELVRNRPCLGWARAYAEQNTKAFQYKNFSLSDSSALVLEGLRELTVRRELACAKPPADEVSLEERVHRLERYLQLLHNFVDRSDALLDAKTRAQLGFEWTLPQAASSAFHSLQGVRHELALALMLYAAVVRQQADAAALETCACGPEEHQAFAGAAKLFQRAAGIFAYIDGQLLSAEAAASGSKLQQALPQLVRAMGKACLGEAQALVAARAEARASPPSLTAALHLGASELFEGAAAELRPNASAVASQPFRMWLALSSELHQVRARLAVAAAQSVAGHPGAACADLLDATRRAADARTAAATDARWREIFAAELEAVNAAMAVYERERQVVAIERIPGHRSPAPEAKVLAKPAEYTPPAVAVSAF